MVGIHGERFVVPVFGIVVAAELAAGIADERGDIGMVILAERAQRRDPVNVIGLVVNERVGRVVVFEEVLLDRAVLVTRLRLLGMRLLVAGLRWVLGGSGGGGLPSPAARAKFAAPKAALNVMAAASNRVLRMASSQSLDCDILTPDPCHFIPEPAAATKESLCLSLGAILRFWPFSRKRAQTSALHYGKFT